jgi:GTP-binding protein HflX
MQEVTGNTTGLKPAQLKMLERVYRRRVAPADLVGPELATFLCEISTEIGRQVGILVDRRGQIEHVVVGDASKLYLPDVGRLRAARGRFRGLRLVHTHLRGEPLTHDDLTDLVLLRLDAIAAISVERGGRAGQVSIAHMIPVAAGADPWRVLPPRPAHHLDLDFVALIRSLEEEFARTTDRVVATETGKDRALVVVVQAGKLRHPAGTQWRHDAEGRVAELRELCRTAGVRVLDVIEQHRPEPDPKFLVGKGKLEQIVIRAMQLGAELLVFDPDLTPGQARAISDFTDLKVIDRTMLILDIFAQRAHTRDGKLQVELAQLRYTLPRLVEKNTMMSRLVGGPRAGIGGRGPGETKLEINRRRAREKIQRLEKQIQELGRRRTVRRAEREKHDVPIVSIVGYTNAGKSTLWSALTRAETLVEDKLFATLDPTTRRLQVLRAGPDGLPVPREVVLTDTVGFIRDLPKDLVNAFRATLEELAEADLLIHVVDAADPDHPQQIQSVVRILGDLELAQKPRLLVFNKIDALPPGEGARLAAEHGAVPISARDPSTLSPLLRAIEEELWKEGRTVAPRAAASAPAESPDAA